jgi:hypothetical protein
LGILRTLLGGLLLLLYAVSLDFIDAVAWILWVFSSTRGVSSTSCWVHNLWWIINYCSVSSWAQQMWCNLLDLTHVVTDFSHSHSNPSGANAHQLLYNWQLIFPLRLLTF